MCTISVVPVVGGFSLTCNRDETLVRAAAVAPTSRRIGGVEAVFPTDTQGGGTWIAATDAGLAFALLNRCPARREPHEGGCAPPSTDLGAQTHTRTTRGEIILGLLTATHLGAVHRRVQRLQIERYEPFQLIVVGGRRLLTATVTGRALDISVRSLHAPVMFTSSSLGDRDAERVRAPLFDLLVRRSADPLEGQRSFHDHRWPGCPSFSVRMRRADARTVSRSVIQIGSRRLTFNYETLVD